MSARKVGGRKRKQIRLTQAMGGSKWRADPPIWALYRCGTVNGPDLPAGTVLDEVLENGSSVYRTVGKDGEILAAGDAFAWRIQWGDVVSSWVMYYQNQDYASYVNPNGDRGNPLATGKDGNGWQVAEAVHHDQGGKGPPPEFMYIPKIEELKSLGLELQTLAGDSYLVNSWFRWDATPAERLELFKQAAAAQHQELAGELLAPARTSRGALCCHWPVAPAKYTAPWQLVVPGAGGGAVVTALGNAMVEALAALPRQQQHLLVLFGGGTAASEEPTMDVSVENESTV